MRSYPLSLITLFCAVTVLTGCGGSFAPNLATPASVTGAAIKGNVHGGQPPIVGSHVYLYAVGTGGYGTAATSLLQAAANTTSDGTNYYVTTDSTGSFSVTSDYTCTSGQALYLYATGGDAGAGPNSAIGLLAALGTCPNSGTLAAIVPYVWVNEVSTVAAAYALSGFATAPTTIASSGTPLAQTGVTNAIATVPNIMDIATGLARTKTPGSTLTFTGTVPTAKINLLANILAACINTAGPTSTGCTTLLSNAQNPSGVQPLNTAQAAINLAHTPAGYTSSSIKNLFSLVTPQQVFSPSLTPVPGDLALPVVYSTDSQAPKNLSIDASGNVWTFDTGETVLNHIYRYSPQGVVTEFPITDPNYGFNGIAVAPSGLIWFVDTGSNAMRAFNNNGTLQFTATGGGLYYPQAMGFDSNGNAWVANFGSNTVVSEFSPTGSALVTNGYTTAANSTSGIALDSTNALWLSANGTAVYSPSPYTTSTATDLSFSGFGIAVDSANASWFTNGGLLTRVTPQGTKTVCVTQGQNSSAYGIVVDGAGVLWGADYTDTSTTGVFAISSTCGTPAGSNNVQNGAPPADAVTPLYVAVDGSGNVWAISEGRGHTSQLIYDVMTQYIGLATPVATPIQAGKQGMRP